MMCPTCGEMEVIGKPCRCHRARLQREALDKDTTVAIEDLLQHAKLQDFVVCGPRPWDDDILECPRGHYYDSTAYAICDACMAEDLASEDEEAP